MTRKDRPLKSDSDKDSGKADTVTSKKAWQSMKLTHTGEAKDVVRGGGGKTSPSPNDPGDVRKPPGLN
ncbi:MAG TPA: hypothetical protein VK208_10825 [Pyrinomonadaceae bacterium]|nr:hypothetical protein [Pyrinomonadaceae bacterium]